jgi:hypothetical protein
MEDKDIIELDKKLEKLGLKELGFDASRIALDKIRLKENRPSGKTFNYKCACGWHKAAMFHSTLNNRTITLCCGFFEIHWRN